MIGFDKYPINHQLILGIPMDESLQDALNHDRARPHHTMTPGATATNPVPTVVPLSNLNYLLFDDADTEYLSTPEIADLRFGPALPFTLAVWLNADALPGIVGLINKGIYGAASVAGYNFFFDTNGAIHIVTNRAGPAQDDTFSADGEITIGTWCFVVATFDGAGNCLVFKNGVDITDTAAGTHAPVADVAEDIYVACLESAAATPSNYFSGGLWNPRTWSRALSQWDVEEIFQVERSFLGV